jgi:hypothetical protein
MTEDMIKETKFEEGVMAATDRYHTIHEFLRNNSHCILEFKKKDGTLRTMPCTLDSNFMPPPAVNEFHQTRLVDYETMTVWCEDKQAWRAFKTMNVLSIRVAE